MTYIKLFSFSFFIFTIFHYVSGSCGKKSGSVINGTLCDYTIGIQTRIQNADKKHLSAAIIYTKAYASLRIEESLLRLSIGDQKKKVKYEKRLSKSLRECNKLGISAFCRDLANYVLSDLSVTPDSVIREVTAEVTGENTRVSITELQMPDSSAEHGNPQSEYVLAAVDSLDDISEKITSPRKTSSVKSSNSQSVSDKAVSGTTPHPDSPSNKVVGSPMVGREVSTPAASDKSESEDVVGSSPAVSETVAKERRPISGDLVSREELNEETISLVGRSIVLLIEDSLGNKGLTIESAPRDELIKTREEVFIKFEDSLATRIRDDPFIASSPSVPKYLWSYLYYAEEDINSSGEKTNN